MKIYALSDQHGHLDFELPEADLILHAGDICPDFSPGSLWGRQKQEEWLLKKWIPWTTGKKVEATFGNHDFIAAETFLDAIKVDTLLSFKKLKIWFSPWSNRFGAWSWMARPDHLADIYADIPRGVDIIVSHQPPFGFGDQVARKWRQPDEDPDGHVGSVELLAAIDRVQPKVVICGHIHSGYGSYQYNHTTIHNVAIVNEAYERVNPPTEIII